VLPLISAILTHFNEKGERKNRMAARIKFLIRKEGWDAFVAEVNKILATLPRPCPSRWIQPTPPSSART